MVPRLGRVAGLWQQVRAGGDTLRVHRRLFSGVKPADAAMIAAPPVARRQHAPAQRTGMVRRDQEGTPAMRRQSPAGRYLAAFTGPLMLTGLLTGLSPAAAAVPAAAA